MTDTVYIVWNHTTGEMFGVYVDEFRAIADARYLNEDSEGCTEWVVLGSVMRFCYAVED